MTYKEILETSLTEDEKQDNLKKYYIDEVKVLEWLEDKDCVQTINFNDRIEYRVGGKLHKLTGPAVVKTNGNKEYHIKGKNYSEEDWNKEKIKILRNRKLNMVI